MVWGNFYLRKNLKKTKEIIFIGDDPEKQKFSLCLGFHFNKELQYFYRCQWFSNWLKAHVDLIFWTAPLPSSISLSFCLVSCFSIHRRKQGFACLGRFWVSYSWSLRGDFFLNRLGVTVFKQLPSVYFGFILNTWANTLQVLPDFSSTHMVKE